jgi:hypothetical protein
MNREDTWKEISRLLMDTSEKKHKLVDIPLDYRSSFGLSTNDMLHINEIWQDEKEGIITFKIRGCDVEYDLSEEPVYIQKDVHKNLKRQ